MSRGENHKVLFMHVELFHDTDARNLIDDPSFIQSWHDLCHKCPTATSFQSPSFVRAWFHCYSEHWRPIVVLSREKDGDLSALWILANSLDARKITHPGAHQSEYQTWIAKTGADIDFFSAAWAEITRQLPLSSLKIKYFPNAELARAIQKSPKTSRICIVNYHKRPLLELNTDNIEASFKKKANKSRLNRLKKQGEIQFRRIATREELDAVFDQLIAFYDFRQGATHNSIPFRSDPCKRAFLSNLLADPENRAYVTTTLLDGQPIAAFWGAVSSGIVHLGMLIHSPFYAENSPGKLHIMQLSKHLAEHGKQTIDLTPGGDTWKERFANIHDEVAEIDIFKTARARLIALLFIKTQLYCKRCINAAGLSTSAIKSYFWMFRKITPKSVARKLCDWAYTKRELRIYRCERGLSDRITSNDMIRCNSLPDLISFEPGETWQTSRSFLTAALHRIENGESAFTISINKKLAASGWLVKDQRTSVLSEVHQTMLLPEGSVSLYDFYTDPKFRGRGLYRQLIAHMLQLAFSNENTKYAYICVLADNGASRHVIEKAGFQHQGSFYLERKFGRLKKWADKDASKQESIDA